MHKVFLLCTVGELLRVVTRAPLVVLESYRGITFIFRRKGLTYKHGKGTMNSGSEKQGDTAVPVKTKWYFYEMQP